MHLAHDIIIYANVDRVFTYVTKHDIRKYWQDGLIRTIVHDPVSGNDNMVGQVFTDITQKGKKSITTDGAIFAYEHLSVYAFRLTTRFYKMDIHYYFKGTGKQTELRYQAVVHFKNLILKIASPFLKRKMEQKLHKRLISLKRLSEN
jgi:hypothetical protein